MYRPSKACCRLVLAWVAPMILVFLAHAEPVESPVEVVRFGPVNDQIVDAVSPGGLVRTRAGDLLTTFTDKGDSAAGSKCYVVRSEDEGKTWSEPYIILEPTTPKEGLFTGLASLPDGRVLMTVTRIGHTDTTRESVFGYRESTVELHISDDGDQFAPAGRLDTAPAALTSVMGTVVTLPNDDLIMPAYCYASGPREHPGYRYGSGFFRSVDGGAHWGPMETIFRDPPNSRDTRQRFNESAFAVRKDGTVIAYARVDVHRGDDFAQNKLWRSQSADNGLTWSIPVETDIAGIFPAIVSPPSGGFVMACGLRDSKVMRRTTTLFTSADAILWQQQGHAYYSRTGGVPENSATGGSQNLLPMEDGALFVVFYAHDSRLPGRDKTYVDGCVLRLPTG